LVRKTETRQESNKKREIASFVSMCVNEKERTRDQFHSLSICLNSIWPR